MHSAKNTFLSGSRLWVESLDTVLRSQAMWRVLRSCFHKLVWITVLTNILCIALLVPMYAVLLVCKLLLLPLSYIVGSWAALPVEVGPTFLWTWNSMMQCIWATGPWLQLLVLRYLASSQLDQIFFSVLADRDAVVAAELKSLQQESTTTAFMRSAQRQLKLLPLYPLPWLLSFIPVIGALAWPACAVYLLQRKVGPYRALACALLTTLPMGIGTLATSLIRSKCSLLLLLYSLLLLLYMHISRLFCSVAHRSGVARAVLKPQACCETGMVVNTKTKRASGAWLCCSDLCHAVHSARRSGIVGGGRGLRSFCAAPGACFRPYNRQCRI